MTNSPGSQHQENADSSPATPRPPQIRAEHLRKLAIVYLRQSSAVQVREHTGSTAAQRALADLPGQWGWPPSRIKVIDGDLGQSGTSSKDRSGFHHMLDLIDRDEASLIIARDPARVSRDPLDSETFVSKVIEHGVLLYANGQLFDPATEGLPELFGHRIQFLLAWYENRTRVQTMSAARAAKARQGHAVTRPPIGYVQAVRGKWIKDPDLGVQDAVRRLFDLYQELGSIGNVLRYMREHALLFPHRRRGETAWEPPVRSHVASILKNPSYTGDYAFRWQRTNQLPKTRTRQIARPGTSEPIAHPAHHEPYIAHAQWEAIQASLAARRPTVRPPVGRGPALLQGLLWCVRCERWMYTTYQGREGTIRRPSYVCWACDRSEKHLHGLSCRAPLVDGPVIARVLAALRPIGMKTALMAIEEHRRERATISKDQARLLQQAEHDVDAARRQYGGVDPRHALVRADLEARLEDALERRDELHRQIANTASAAPPTLTTKDTAELMALANDIDELWSAPTTTDMDRKGLLRTVISRVLVREATEDALELEIVWVGGLTEHCRVLRYGGIDDLVQALWKTGKDAQAIADELRARDIRSRFGRWLTKENIQVRLRLHDLIPRVDRVKVLAVIRSLLVEGRARREILEHLQREAPPRSGPWTSSRLAYAISDLRRGVAGIERLPATPPAGPTKQATMDLITQRRAEGHTYKEIASELNSRGYRPQKTASFSAKQVFGLLHDPNRRRPKEPQAKGGSPRPSGRGSVGR